MSLSRKREEDALSLVQSTDDMKSRVSVFSCTIPASTVVSRKRGHPVVTAKIPWLVVFEKVRIEVFACFYEITCVIVCVTSS